MQGTVMAYVDIVTALAVLQFIVFGLKVGKARAKYGIEAPAITGNEVFERHFRVQQNTLELLVVFVPGIYLFSRYFNPLWAVVLGVMYLLGRELYAAAYVRSPKARGAGFGLSAIPSWLLVGGGLGGAVLRALGS